MTLNQILPPKLNKHFLLLLLKTQSVILKTLMRLKSYKSKTDSNLYRFLIQLIHCDKANEQR